MKKSHGEHNRVGARMFVCIALVSCHVHMIHAMSHKWRGNSFHTYIFI